MNNRKWYFEMSKLMGTAVIAIAALWIVLPAAHAGSVSSDEVVINGGGIYPNSDVVFPEGPGASEASNVLIGGAPIFGGLHPAFNIYLTEPGTNIVSDHLFNGLTGVAACFAAQPNNQGPGTSDCIYFSSDPSTDASIGAPCTAVGTTSFCIPETGTLQDMTPFITIWNGGSGIFGGGSIKVQSDVVPEPSTIIMLGTGLLGLSGSLKRKFFS